MKILTLILFFLTCTAPLCSAAPSQENSSVAESALQETNTRPIVDLEQLRVLELDKEKINWRQDWWKYLTMLVLGLLAICLIIYLTKLLFWLFGVIVCLASGIAGGTFLHILFTPWLPQFLPEALTDLLPPTLICRILGGILGYGLAACILTIVTKPLKPGKKKNG